MSIWLLGDALLGWRARLESSGAANVLWNRLRKRHLCSRFVPDERQAEFRPGPRTSGTAPQVQWPRERSCRTVSVVGKGWRRSHLALVPPHHDV